MCGFYRCPILKTRFRRTGFSRILRCFDVAAECCSWSWRSERYSVPSLNFVPEHLGTRFRRLYSFIRATLARLLYIHWVLASRVSYTPDKIYRAHIPGRNRFREALDKSHGCWFVSSINPRTLVFHWARHVSWFQWGMTWLYEFVHNHQCSSSCVRKDARLMFRSRMFRRYFVAQTCKTI